ncbi:MAG: Flagellar M-ring protein [Pseudomonadota bacterium]|jgi:flagellar M-ring protein FliF
MADLVPSGPAPSLIAPLRDAAGGPMLTRIGSFAAQPPVRKALPWFAGIAGAGLLALTWATMAPAPQRVLYSSLDDSERASVVEALDKASITYAIDNDSGALTVGEDDLYRARMLVASNGALATPETGAQMLDSLPMGASRTLEGDRLRAAQERELTLTIQEIDGVESVRVHLAKPERSVFVRDDVAPSASVMVRMARGRQLSASQTTAIANLVAASVPGLTVDAVRIVDQNGRLLLQATPGDADRIDLQARMEDKLHTQVEQLLGPMIGAANFTSEIQVQLDMNEVTSARESYDKNGAVRRETTEQSQSTGPGAAAGVPGVLSNTPPLPAQAVPGAPQGTPAPAPAAAAAAPAQGESSSTRTYELGREVAVSNQGPGTLKRLSVAVALNQTALKGAKPADLAKIRDLVSAAVGADPARGDKVEIIIRPFAPADVAPPQFWETQWFAMAVRNGVALLSVLLVLLLAVRPVVKSLTGRRAVADAADDEGDDDAQSEARQGEDAGEPAQIAARIAGRTAPAEPGREQLTQQIELAQRIVREQPDDALLALRRMIGDANMNEAA